MPTTNEKLNEFLDNINPRLESMSREDCPTMTYPNGLVPEFSLVFRGVEGDKRRYRLHEYASWQNKPRLVGPLRVAKLGYSLKEDGISARGLVAVVRQLDLPSDIDGMYATTISTSNGNSIAAMVYGKKGDYFVEQYSSFRA